MALYSPHLQCHKAILKISNRNNNTLYNNIYRVTIQKLITHILTSRIVKNVEWTKCNNSILELDINLLHQYRRFGVHRAIIRLTKKLMKKN